MTFTVAIVGRPNVGKSTLFNRLIGRRLALVDDTPGVTRDRREAEAQLAGLSFRVIDTAGLEDVADESLEGRMRAQTERAVDDADVTLFLIDARAGVTPVDEHFAGWLRAKGRPVILAANKCESSAADSGFYEAFALGLGEPIAISAEHGHGIGELLSALVPYAETAGEAEDTDAGEGPLHLAVVGRPNTGKSTLINRLIGEERLLTGPEAGITRDAIAIDWHWHDQALRLFDTAGLRRRAHVVGKVERLSAADTLRAIRFAHVVVLVIDATVMLERQDLAIASQVVQEGRALVIAANKWDIVADRNAASRLLQDRLQTSLPQVRGLPVVTVSALKGENLDRLMDAVIEIFALWNTRLTTGQLNRWLEAMTESHPPPLTSSGRRNRLRYMTQVKSRPPTFAIWTSRPEDLPDSYQRYLVNGLRDDFALAGVPIRLQLRKGRNPYVKGR